MTAYMDNEAKMLFAETADKNMIDKDEYPQTAQIEGRCVRMISGLWNAPDGEKATGTSTTGSGEARMLGGMALKWRWRQRTAAAGLPSDRPNLVMGINVQVVWEKFCRYWDVEPRYAPVEEGRLQLNAEEAVKLCDENTIGVIAIMGSTDVTNYTVYDVSAKMRERGWQVPASSLPDNLTGVSGLRVVVRNGFSRDMAELFLADLAASTEFLESLSTKLPHDPSHTESFRH